MQQQKSTPVVSLSVTSTGHIASLRSTKFTVWSPDSTIETCVDDIHKEPCTSLIFQNSKEEQDEHDLQGVFVASAGMVSSWEPHGTKYSLVSSVKRQCSRTNPTAMYLSPCGSAIAIIAGDSVDILAVAENLGISHFAKMDQSGQSVTSAALVSRERSPYVLILAGNSGSLSVWDIMKQVCLHKIDPSPTGCRETGTIICATAYDVINQQCFIGKYQDQQFQLFSFKDISNEADAKRRRQIEKMVTMNNIPGGEKGLSINFVNDNGRLCILATIKHILIIDSLLQCVAKRISIQALSPKLGISTSNYQCHIASVQFPYVSIHSNQLPFPLRYELDEVFALAGSLQSKGENQENNRFKPLVISDPDSIHKFNAKFARIDRKQPKASDHNKVKSSGYCRVEQLIPGKCPSSLKREAQRKAARAKSAQKAKHQRKMSTYYPIDCSIIDSHQKTHDDNDSPSLLPPLATVSFDSFGEYLAAASVDRGFHIFKLPMSKHGAASHQMFHSHPSVDGRKLPPISSCRPCWSKSNNKKMIAYDHKVYGLSTSMKSLKVLLDLGNDASNAAFCAKDKILIHTDKNTLSLSQFSSLDTSLLMNKQTQNTQGKSKTNNKTQSFHHGISFETAQRITSVASVNGVETNIIAASCSDKTLHVLDIISGNVLWSQRNIAGARAAHSIAFPQVSENIPLSPDNFNILLAASTDEGGLISLCDLRCGEIVKSFRGHVNRRDPCQVTFSPCMRFIGTGGEGHCAPPTIYDIRATGNSPISTNLGRDETNMPFRDDSILDVQFHPIYPQIVTASLSGRLRWYTE